MDKKELDFILQEGEYLNFDKELIIVQNLESNSLGLSTSTSDNSLSDLSPENIGHFNSNANVTYCTSFKCLEEIFLAFGKDLENSVLGIKFICPSTNSKSLSKISLDNPDLSNISSLCLSNSTSMNSGATNSNLLNTLLIANTSKESPLLNREESTTLTSTTTNIPYSKYLCDKEELILSENSLTSLSENLDLDNAFLSLEISPNLDLINLLTTIDQSISETCLKNPISSGILIFNSDIIPNRTSQYLKLSEDIKFETDDFFRVTFYRSSIEKKEGLVEGLVETQKRILNLISTNNKISKQELSKNIGISTTAIDKNISKLKQKGLLRRIGPAKGGYWKVKEVSDEII